MEPAPTPSISTWPHPREPPSRLSTPLTSKAQHLHQAPGLTSVRSLAIPARAASRTDAGSISMNWRTRPPRPCATGAGKGMRWWMRPWWTASGPRASASPTCRDPTGSRRPTAVGIHTSMPKTHGRPSTPMAGSGGTSTLSRCVIIWGMVAATFSMTTISRSHPSARPRPRACSAPLPAEWRVGMSRSGSRIQSSKRTLNGISVSSI